MNLSHRMGMANPDLVAQATMAGLSGLQSYTQEAQIMGSAVLFLRICERFGISPSEALRYSTNLLASEAEHRPQFRAIREYLAHEFK